MHNAQNTSQIGADTQNRLIATDDERTQRVEQLIRDHEKVIYAGLWSVMKGQEDLAEDTLEADVRSLFIDMWIWMLENLDSLLTPGTATISTRLYTRAMWTAQSWKTTQLRYRRRFVSYDEHLAALDDDQHLPTTRLLLNRACESLVDSPPEHDPSDAVTELENNVKPAAQP
jgi:hypothetical protein